MEDIRLGHSRNRLSDWPQHEYYFVLENEVRAPGGLYGNLEYIPFSRDNPYSSFEKFLQMLGAINPKDKPEAATSMESKTPSTESEKVAPIEGDWEPQPDWSVSKYHNMASGLISVKDEAGLKRLDASFRTSPHASAKGISLWEGRLAFTQGVINDKFGQR